MSVCHIVIQKCVFCVGTHSLTLLMHYFNTPLAKVFAHQPFCIYKLQLHPFYIKKQKPNVGILKSLNSFGQNFSFFFFSGM